ncbi:hypothetical protein ACBR28_22305 [Pseudomonas aeruginosa]|uniref:hypothetical protein n=1 Tax=Pseudomonas aeruginosa TaxID=287 RepID=UPI00352626AB
MTQPTSKPNPSPWSSRSAGAVGQPPAKPCPTQSGRGESRASLFGAQYRSCQQELSRGGWFW